jgi:2-keto-4-pentenoate hydratase
VSDAYDPAAAAALLAAAWKDGTRLVELPAAVRPRTLQQGYDVQDALIDRLGDRVAGWKLGVGSPNAMRMTGAQRPIAGRVLAAACYGLGETVTIANGASVVVEFEIAFVLARDIAPGTAPHSPLDAVSDTRVTFELVQSRFVDRRAVGWPSFAADNAAFRTLVVGPAMASERIRTLVDEVIVRVDGRETARGAVGDDRTDAIASLDALFAHAAERGITLQRGMIVSTGSVSQPFDLGASGTVVAAAPGIELEVRIEFV